ncbi:hypothetical protein GCM10008949_51620 [Deinococcus humi]|nr:hypothetical protein GCM10008949_51620 [Deinococcus humi]
MKINAVHTVIPHALSLSLLVARGTVGFPHLTARTGVEMRTVHPWHASFKSQGHTLKASLHTHGHGVPLGYALDLCAQFAGHPS